MIWAVAFAVLLPLTTGRVSTGPQATVGPATDLPAGWTEIPTAVSPPPMAGAMMAYSSVDQRFVLFGGWDGVAALNETWVFDSGNRTWSQLNPGNGPMARGDEVFVYDERADAFVLFGGWTDGPGGTYLRLSDTWTFSLRTSIWTERHPPTVPAPRSDGQVSYDPQTGTVFLFGGFNGGFNGSAYLGDSWIYSPVRDNWTRVYPSVEPPPRADGRMVYDVAQDRLILFGGNDYNGPGFTFHHLADTWWYNRTLNRWGQVPTTGAPPARDYPILAANPRSGNLLLASGYGNRTSLADLWAFDLANDTWSEITSTPVPPARFASAGGFDPVENVLVVFGGATDSGLLADTWYYSPHAVVRPDGPTFPTTEIVLSAGLLGLSGIIAGIAITRKRHKKPKTDPETKSDHGP